MNEVAYVSEQASRRVNLRDLADLPCDMVAIFDALDDLNPWQFKTWFRLRVHLYRYGELPTGMKALARIARIGAAAFERMAAAIARHFDRAADGRWTDNHLVRARGNRIVMRAAEAPTVDPELRAKRAASGGNGGRVTQQRKRQMREDETSSGSASLFASPVQANEPSKSLDATLEFASSMLEDREANASRGQSLSVGLLESESKKEDQTGQLTSNLAAGAGADTASGQAKPPNAAEATGQANQALRDEVMIAGILKICGSFIDAPHVNERLAEYRSWIAKGCAFETDIVPAVRDFVAGKTSLDNCANVHIREIAFRRRDYRLRAPAPASETAPSIGVFVLKDAPPWRAWLRHKGVRSMFTTELQSDRTQRGTWLNTLWPPGWDEAKLSAAEAGTERR